jgi:hypothetical protein
MCSGTKKKIPLRNALGSLSSLMLIDGLYIGMLKGMIMTAMTPFSGGADT